MAFLQYGGGGMVKKRRGMFGEEIVAPEGTGEVNTLLDPETSAMIAAKYPMKSEFNDAWVQRREDNPGAFPVGEQPQIPLGGFMGDTRQQYIPPTETPAPISDVRAQYQTPPTFPAAEAQVAPGGAFPVVQPEPVAPVAPVRGAFPVASEQTQARINAINQKDYSKPVYDDQGNLIKPAGKDRDKKWSTMEKIGNAALGALLGLRNGIGGAIAGGVMAGTDRNFNEKLDDKRELGRLYPQLSQQQQAEANQRKASLERTQEENIKTDNDYNLARLEETKRDRERKDSDRISKERTARMNAVAGMFKSVASYDPNDPKFAELTQALGDVNLPITPKDAGKQVDLKQDQRTGEWTTILTDKVTGKQEVRPVTKDGKVYASTPTVVMQGEYGLLRQDKQQEFTADENEKNRQQQVRLSAIAQEQRIQLEAIKTANEVLKTQITGEQRRQAEERRNAAQQRYNELRNERLTLQNQKLATGQ